MPKKIFVTDYKKASCENSKNGHILIIHSID